MEEITSQVLRPGTFAIAVAVVIATFFIRRIVEILLPRLKHKDDVSYETKAQMWWNSVILYAIPVLLGCAAAAVKSEWLFGDIDKVGAKVMFGGGVGWFSSFLYKIFRKVILQKTGVDIQPSDTAEPDKPDTKPEG